MCHFCTSAGNKHTGNRGAHGRQKHTSERSGLQAVVGLVAVTHVLTKNGIELASFVKINTGC